MKTFGLAAAFAAALLPATGSDSFAQGCILNRQTAPLFGTTGSLDGEVGTWTITFSGRSAVADTHYNGTERQIQREIEQTYVVNRQNSLTATVTYQMTPRFSVVAGIPFVEASWGIPSPRGGGPATRANENANGSIFCRTSPCGERSSNLYRCPECTPGM